MWIIDWEDREGEVHKATTKDVNSFCDYLDEIGGCFLSKYEAEPGMVFPKGTFDE